ncbi:FAD-linked oxidase C-terminal domain-containing protein [Sporomusa carbonis]|uniref:FAD-linked oxidase C-terminal domain-containing protein n=1 Tax=Sporomusa carbonis TaxID=3076075 RepID=UPI003C7BF1B7
MKNPPINNPILKIIWKNCHFAGLKLLHLSIVYKSGLPALSFQTADGNIHVNILKEQMSDAEWNEKLPALQDELYVMVYSLGSKLSGEHGIGYKRLHLLEKYADPAEIKMMKAIKRALDPPQIHLSGFKQEFVS